MKSKIGKTDIVDLVDELTELESWVNPKPDPTVWPPVGYEPHPTTPGLLGRVVSEESLREELFGSEEKTEWIKQANARIAEIKKTLTDYFFPTPKEEGTQRLEKHGFAVMLKTGLDRKIDKEALPVVLAECEAISAKRKLGISVEQTVIEYKPALKLKEFRELPTAIQKQLEEALIITPTKPQFEIVKLPQ